MIKMLLDGTYMTKADNRIIDSITTNSSHYNKTFSENHLEEISPQSKALCRGDWGLCHQQVKVQMSDICPACNFSFQLLHQNCRNAVSPNAYKSLRSARGLQFFPLSEEKFFFRNPFSGGLRK